MSRAGQAACPTSTIQCFFRQLSPRDSFAMRPCKDFMAKFSSSQRLFIHWRLWLTQILLKWAELLKFVAALVVLPTKLLRGNMRCPSAQCGCTDLLWKKAYNCLHNQCREYSLSVSLLSEHWSQRSLIPQSLGSCRWHF